METPHTVASSFSVQARCTTCNAVRTFAFQLEGGKNQPEADSPLVINATDEPSRVLDVAQWLTLSAVIVEQAGREGDKKNARRLSIEAALCLEEALKFFEEENNLPPPSAFFHDGSRQRFRRHPEQFSRQRLLHLRSKLPHSGA